MAFTSRAVRSMGLEVNVTPNDVAPGAYNLAGQVLSFTGDSLSVPSTSIDETLH